MTTLAMTFVDHYDSFSDNLLAWLRQASVPLALERVAFDDAAAMARTLEKQCALVLSPGPKSPQEARATVELAKSRLGKVPILGVCLGHQILGTIAGGRVEPSLDPCHGLRKALCVEDRQGFLAELGEPCAMAAYHSLVVVADGPWAAPWSVTARCPRGEIAALEYRPDDGRAWALGVQFHPESFLSEAADPLRTAWFRYVEHWEATRRSGLRPGGA